ncbi:MAG: methyltransferase domain-containing protein [Candidatus Eisenbacteria bacterium]|uniref:Methyltransferase domain-containing protein n=1 Tax=Eiseniibacteriota bacterium TaxID=2212470 RepID=A0A948RTW9_UNCEI|nr:methyltransferase domain-containing protein [Candidatus Eisenbacteria bacterium]MBU1947690.1 methyltransferase domain-containing protein [Candidatus Eisenbacteria bacterium]MBU2689488.1 methyltransferase domain-containing protein [Candidatus Eisenbacteria bacterium]
MAKKTKSRIEADRHRLYELSVQCPEADIRFLDRIFKKKHGRLPKILREDFCGTATMAAEWIRTRKENTAIGVDLDEEVLDWGREHNIKPLGEAASRLTLHHADVRSISSPKADILAAMNFSYFIFKKREELRDYFRHAKRALKPGGLFVLDIFGGWESQELTIEEKEMEGFTYLWELMRFNPLTHEVLFHIHFHLNDGRKIRKAFTYDWRFWTIPEVRELLMEAGFKSAEIYWEGTEKDSGEGDGVFRLTEKGDHCPGWIAYIVAF